MVQRDPGLDIKAWILVVVYTIVLLLVVAKLFPQLVIALAEYNSSDPSGFGAILQSLTPILIGVAILIVLVVYLLKQADVM